MKDNYEITKESYNKLAQKYEEKFMYADLYNDTFDVFCSYVTKKNAAIFDLACGPGNITKYLLNKRPDYKIFGIDNAPNMIALAKKNNPNANFKIMDCREMHHLQQSFDAAICGFGLPYLSKDDAYNLISNTSKLLSKEGYLYVSLMEGDYKNSGFKKASTSEDQAFIYYHSYHFIEKALIDHSFAILKVIRQDYQEVDGSNTIDLFVIAQKK